MKDETHAANIVDHRRLVWSVDLAPQQAHMHVHKIGLWNELDGFDPAERPLLFYDGLAISSAPFAPNPAMRLIPNP